MCSMDKTITVDLQKNTKNHTVPESFIDTIFNNTPQAISQYRNKWFFDVDLLK